MFFLSMTLALLLSLCLTAAPTWEPLATGIELAEVKLPGKVKAGDGVLRVVRADLSKAELITGLATREKPARTAGEWADALGATVVINLGMFEMDHLSNVGHAHHGAHVNKPGWNKYQSVLLSDAKGTALLDLDAPGVRERAQAASLAVQNLRLIKGTGESVWKPNGREWSEAAIGTDAGGRLYFFFTRSPLTMSAFNALLLSLGIVRAMHVEGGPEASLSIRAGKTTLDLFGSFETGFLEADTNDRQWELPNVLALKPRATK